MSTQITTAFVQQFSSNVYHLAQQKGSRLRGSVRNETQKGKAAFWDQIGLATAEVSSDRHGDTPQSDTPHARRRVTLADYKHGDLFDNLDKVKTLIDPTSMYLQAFQYAFGRAMDDVVIAAASATAYTGETGATSTVLPTSQKIAAVSAGALSNLNVDTLLHAKEILDQNEVGEEIRRYLLCNAHMLRGLLNQTQITSADYNTVKALVNGQIDEYLGFKFIRSERLLTQSGSLLFNATSGSYDAAGAVDSNGKFKALAFASDGLLLSIGEDFKGRMAERPDKCFSMQVYAEMSIGATRMEETKVVEIHCGT